MTLRPVSIILCWLNAKRHGRLMLPRVFRVSNILFPVEKLPPFYFPLSAYARDSLTECFLKSEFSRNICSVYWILLQQYILRKEQRTRPSIYLEDIRREIGSFNPTGDTHVFSMVTNDGAAWKTATALSEFRPGAEDDVEPWSMRQETSGPGQQIIWQAACQVIGPDLIEQFLSYWTAWWLAVVVVPLSLVPRARYHMKVDSPIWDSFSFWFFLILFLILL
jgi:hypothetical protein